jgi:DNA-binding GntR family transcriptional regulator
MIHLSETLRDQALTIIRHRIVTGEFAPDEIFSAVVVADELGVSRAPVREAMLTLVNEGYMEPVRNRGFRVVPLSDTARREIYELRMMLEPPAMAKLAASHARDAAAAPQFHEFAERTVYCAETGDLVGHLEADRQFHQGLTALAGNEQLTRFVMQLRDRTRRYSIRSMSAEELTSNAREHFALLDALNAGDPLAAQEVMEAHLEHLGLEIPDSAT